MKQRTINIADIELPQRPAAYAAPGTARERFDARTGQVAGRLGTGSVSGFRHIGRPESAVDYRDGE